tara:strand:- start:2167 stop:2364 length:198 start_codon:yes stop_codon:yes gene_type:complete
MDESNLPDFTMYVTIDDVRVLHYSVEEAIRMWPGSPARPHEEQEQMWKIRDHLYRMILDYSFEHN